MAACELAGLMDRLEEEMQQSQRCKARINELITEVLKQQKILESHHASSLQIHRALQQLLPADRAVGPAQADVEDDDDDDVPDPRELEISQGVLAEESIEDDVLPMTGEPLGGPGTAEPAVCTQHTASCRCSSLTRSLAAAAQTQQHLQAIRKVLSGEMVHAEFRV